MRFSNHAPLADYFDELLRSTTNLSYTLIGKSTSPNPSFDLVWPESNRTRPPIESPSSASDFKNVAHETFSSLTSTWLGKSRSPIRPPSTPTHVPDTSLLPILQMGSFQINQETSLVVPRIIQLGNALASAPGGLETTLDWTSGYFSILREYKIRVLETRAKVQIVAAAPEVRAPRLRLCRGTSDIVTDAAVEWLLSVCRRLKVHPSGVHIPRKAVLR